MRTDKYGPEREFDHATLAKRLTLAAELVQALTPSETPPTTLDPPAPRPERDTLERLAIAELLILGPNASKIAKKIGVKRSDPTGVAELSRMLRPRQEGRRSETAGAPRPASRRTRL